MEYFWQGHRVGALASTLAKLINFLQSEVESLEQALALFDQWQLEAGYRWCIGRLAAQNQSKKQLHQKLRQRGLSDALIEKVLLRLEKSSYLDEESLGKHAFEKAIKQRKSHRFIDQSLRSKGLKLKGLDFEDRRNQDVENALYWLNRWGQKEDLSEKITRYMSRLVSRGFDFEVCQLAWQQWLQENKR